MAYTIINTPLIYKKLSPNPSYLAVHSSTCTFHTETNKITINISTLYTTKNKRKNERKMREEKNQRIKRTQKQHLYREAWVDDAVEKIKRRGKPNPGPIEFSLKYHFFSLFFFPIIQYFKPLQKENISTSQQCYSFILLSRPLRIILISRSLLLVLVLMLLLLLLRVYPSLTHLLINLIQSLWI